MLKIHITSKPVSRLQTVFVHALFHIVKKGMNLFTCLPLYLVLMTLITSRHYSFINVTD